MDKDKLRFLLFPIPIVILFSIIFQLHMIVGDFNAHAFELTTSSNYAPGLAYLLEAARAVMPPDLALFLISLIVVVYLPYVLVFEITRSHTAAWAYLYASSIPMMLFYLWFVPQAIIHVFMLLFVLSWWWAIPFLFLGWVIHSIWWAAFLLVLAYKLFWRVG